MQNKEVAQKFYQSFQKKDAQGMAECYADHIVFSDPVFPQLIGKDAKDMWRMLCVTGKDLRIEYCLVESPELGSNEVQVRWDAWYTFSKTGRAVHNIITATMSIENGKIVRHQDHFSFWRWSRQALGPAGLLLGWTPVIQQTVRKGAAESLKKFQSK